MSRPPKPRDDRRRRPARSGRRCRPGSAPPAAASSRWRPAGRRSCPGSRRPRRRARLRARAIRASAATALGAAATSAAGGLQGSAGAGQRRLFGGDRVARRLRSASCRRAGARRSAAPRRAGRGPGRPPPRRQPCSRSRYSVRAARSSTPAGADDDAEHIRSAGLVDRDQAVAQRRPAPACSWRRAAARGGPWRRRARRRPGRARPAWPRAGRGPLASRPRIAATSPVRRSIRSP